MSEQRPEALDPKMLDSIIGRMKIGYLQDGYFDKDARRLYDLKDWLAANGPIATASELESERSQARADADKRVAEVLEAYSKRPTLEEYDKARADVAELEGKLEQSKKLYELTLSNELRWMQKHDSLSVDVAELVEALERIASLDGSASPALIAVAALAKHSEARTDNAEESGNSEKSANK